MLFNDKEKNTTRRHCLKPPTSLETSVAKGFNFPSSDGIVLKNLLTKGYLYCPFYFHRANAGQHFLILSSSTKVAGSISICSLLDFCASVSIIQNLAKLLRTGSKEIFFLLNTQDFHLITSHSHKLVLKK